MTLNSPDNAPSSVLLCPRERYTVGDYLFEEKLDAIDQLVAHDSADRHLSTDYSITPLLHSYHRHSLVSRYNEAEHLNCWICLKRIKGKTPYYYCNFCMGEIHKECVESPSILHSSDHPRHPLKLIGRFDFGWNNCYSCGENYGLLFYYCSTCDFIIHPICVQNPTPLTIDNPKRHAHTLHYFPRKSDFPCDFCGLAGDSGYSYICLLCDVIFHKRCVYLPDVIHLSRHDHPLAITRDIPFKECTCRICYEKIGNMSYEIYTCVKECDYTIHSRCAIRRDVYDKEELEKELEEAYGNLKMFEEKGDGVIRHLSHPDHQMRLSKKIQRLYDETKHCQVCILPFYKDEDVYQCMQCDDFILHESCAYIRRVIQFKLHVHPLILKFERTQIGSKCTKCSRYSYGYRYVCRFPMCQWELDIHCASLKEVCVYGFHKHPLVMRFTQNRSGKCSICLRNYWQQFLVCCECDFTLCFHCATLPNKVRYEHDEHLLILSNKIDRIFEVYWCEICEEDIDRENMLYACKECKTTLHVECILGRDPYMKPGTSSKVYKEPILTLPNTHSTRPICSECKRRCPYKVYMESSNDIFCCIECCERSKARAYCFL